MRSNASRESEIESIIYQIIGYVGMMEDRKLLKRMVERLEKLMEEKKDTNSEVSE